MSVLDNREPPTTGATIPSVLPFPGAGDVRRVVIRVQGGEEIEIGRTEGRAGAVELAHQAIRAIDDAERTEAWPEFGERFLRPGAIVSIDVQRADVG